MLIRTASATYVVVVLAGVAGLVALVRRRHPEDLMFVGATIMTALVPLAFFGDSRFKVPVIPLLIIAGATVVALRTRRVVLPEQEGLTPPVSPRSTA